MLKDGLTKRLRAAIQTALFGYDFFISYRHSDAARSARSLHDKLQCQFDCFLDTLHYEAGHNLPRLQSQALKRTRKLLVVVSPRAHISPKDGTDWLLAEVKEFKHLAFSRGEAPEVVPIGSFRTLSPTDFPESKLLPEIPTLTNDHICIIDDAIEFDADVGSESILKLINDFKHMRRRKVRRIASLLALALVTLAMAYASLATFDTLRARRAAQLEQAFGLIARAESAVIENEPAAKRTASYRKAYRQFEELGLDQVMALHGLFKEQLHTLGIEEISDLDGPAGEIKISTDGDWILVVYDYQAPNGEPDLEDILDQTAFGVFHVPSRTWSLKKQLSTLVGQTMYEAKVETFLPPHHVTVWLGDEENKRRIEKLSLLDGSSAGIWMEEKPSAPDVKGESQYARQESELLSPTNLFKVDPSDGIDREYGPRLVGSIQVISPNDQVTLAGTYEGKILLVDNATGQSRGEVLTSPVFAAAFSPDSARAFVATAGSMIEVKTSLSPNLKELIAPSMRGRGFDREHVLAAALSDDGGTIALATTERLLASSLSDANVWTQWPLPKVAERVAALRVDHKRGRIDVVSGDDGAVTSVDYRDPNVSPTVLQRPGGPGPSVAWLDTDSASAWLTASTWTGQKLSLHSVPLPGGSESPNRLEITSPSNEQVALGDEGMFHIHAMAKFPDHFVLFQGDSESFDDRGRHLLDEQQLIVTIRDATLKSQVLFESTFHTTGPDPVSMVTHIQSVLPGSTQDRIFIETDPDGLYSIAPNSPPIDRSGTQYLGRSIRVHSDQEQVYEFSIVTRGAEPWFTVRHEGTGTTLSYPIPWRFIAEAEFTQIALGGRKLLLASESGQVLLVDVAMVR